MIKIIFDLLRFLKLTSIHIFPNLKKLGKVELIPNEKKFGRLKMVFRMTRLHPFLV